MRSSSVCMAWLLRSSSVCMAWLLPPVCDIGRSAQGVVGLLVESLQEQHDLAIALHILSSAPLVAVQPLQEDADLLQQGHGDHAELPPQARPECLGEVRLVLESKQHDHEPCLGFTYLMTPGDQRTAQLYDEVMKLRRKQGAVRRLFQSAEYAA